MVFLRFFGRMWSMIVNLGIDNQCTVKEAKKIKATNVLGFLPMILYIAYFVLGIINQYYFPVIICSTLIVLCITGLYFNKMKQYVWAKNVLFSINILSIFITYNSLNIDYTIMFYFFPIIFAYQIIYDYRADLRFFSFCIILIFIAFFACLVLPKGLIYFYKMDDALLETSKLMNVIIPFIISFLFLFQIMRMNAIAKEELEEAIVNSDNAAKAKMLFLSNMSHELRTPLNGIIGTTDLLEGEEMSKSQKRYFSVIKYSSEHMLNLVNDILDFSKIQSDKLELSSNTFLLYEAIENVARMFQALATNKEITFIKDFGSNLHINVVSDDMRLAQILNNLLSNAFKFTDNGSVTLSAHIISETTNKVTVQFVVKDTGIGIKEEHQQKIFDSFTQADEGTSRKFGGTGLGLSISRQLVSKFNSELIIDSEYEKGSTFAFTITIPKALEETVNVLKAVKKPEFNFNNNFKILIAEDNPINMMVATKFLDKWNIGYTKAKNGQEAVDAFTKQILDYHLVLLDLEMPVMDGHTAIKIIKKQNNNMPVLAFTAALYENMKQDLEEKGFDGYIHKPFKTNDLLKVLQEHYEKMKVEV